MKKFFAVLFLALLVPGLSWASPFVVSDAYPVAAVQPDGFLVSMDGGALVESPADIVSAGSVRLKFDVGNLPEGNHTMAVKAYKDYPAPYGRKESATANFTFTVPASPAVPGGLRLAP